MEFHTAPVFGSCRHDADGRGLCDVEGCSWMISGMLFDLAVRPAVTVDLPGLLSALAFCTIFVY